MARVKSALAAAGLLLGLTACGTPAGPSTPPKVLKLSDIPPGAHVSSTHWLDVGDLNVPCGHIAFAEKAAWATPGARGSYGVLYTYHGDARQLVASQYVRLPNSMWHTATAALHYIRHKVARATNLHADIKACADDLRPLHNLPAGAFGYQGPSSVDPIRHIVRIYDEVDRTHFICVTVQGKYSQPLPADARKLLPIALKRARQ